MTNIRLVETPAADPWSMMASRSCIPYLPALLLDPEDLGQQGRVGLGLLLYFRSPGQLLLQAFLPFAGLDFILGAALDKAPALFSLFSRATLLREALALLHILQVEVSLALGLGDFGPHALLPDLPFVSEALAQVSPLETVQVLHVPEIVVEFAFLADTHGSVVQTGSHQLRYALIPEFNPTFSEVFSIASSLLLFLSDKSFFRLQENASNFTVDTQQVANMPGPEAGRDVTKVNNARNPLFAVSVMWPSQLDITFFLLGPRQSLFSGILIQMHYCIFRVLWCNPLFTLSAKISIWGCRLLLLYTFALHPLAVFTTNTGCTKGQHSWKAIYLFS